MTAETITVTLETEADSDELEVPAKIIDLLNDSDDGTTTVVGDLAMLSIAQQAHGIIHHSQGEVGDEVEAAEELTMELFEERFGQSFAQMTGHDH
jgi:hypothetical protein